MGKLRDAVVAADRPVRVFCTVALLRAQLSKEDSAELDGLLAEDIEATILAEQIRLVHGFVVKPAVLRRHRAGGCKCAPTLQV